MASRRLHGRLARLESWAAALARPDPGLSIQEWLRQLAAAVDPDQRPAVEAALQDFPARGHGLADWLTGHFTGGNVPARVPREVVSVYLADPEALALHDCEDCGLELPVHCGRQDGAVTEPARTYFKTCPVCGGRVGWYAYWHKQPARGPDGNRPAAGPPLPTPLPGREVTAG
jgi:hypothetical protein